MHAGLAFESIDLPETFSTGARLRARWTVPVAQPLVLISQVQRSGGHLLAWLFDGHPACWAHPHELKWGRPKKWDWPSFEVTADLTAQAAFDLLNERWQGVCTARGGFRRVVKAPGATTLTGDAPLYPFVFDPDLHRELFVRLFARRALRSRRDVLDAYLTASFNAWLDCQTFYAAPKRWVTAFIPRVTMAPGALARFFADYPDGHLISIVRHPAAWLASMRGRGRVLADDPTAALQLWRNSVEAGLQAAATHGPRVTIVLFEDLVHRTREVMSALCGTLELPFDPCLLTPTFNGMPMLSNSSHEPAVGVDGAATERHRALLVPADAAVIERTALPLYERAASLHGLSGSGAAPAAAS